MPQPIKTIQDFVLPGQGTTFDENDPHVVALATGKFLIGVDQDRSATDHDARIFAFTASGTSRGNIFSPGPVDGLEDQPAVTGVGGLQGAVAYKDNVAAGNDDVVLQLFNAQLFSGAMSDQIMLDNDAGIQARPEMVNLQTGLIAVAWIDVANNMIETRLVDPSQGRVLTGAVVVDTNSNHGAGAFDLGLTSLSSGNYVVAWRDNAFSANLRIFDGRLGSAIGPEIPIGPAGLTGVPDVTELADGRIAALYVTTEGIKGRIYNADGTVSTAEFNVSGGGDFLAVTSLHDGRILAAWSQGGDIIAQMIQPDGSLDGSAFTVNTVTAGVQSQVSLDTLADGRVAVAWRTDTNGGEIVTTVYDPRESGVNLIGTEFFDELIGSRFDDNISTGTGNDGLVGGEGNDILNGGFGDDDMIGGLGDDIMYVDSFGDIVVEGANQGIDVVRVSLNQYLIALNVEGVELQGTANLTAFGRGTNDFLYGNSGNNSLYGDAGDDLLDGGAGNDYLAGGNGNDWLRGGSGGDTLYGDAGEDVMDGGEGDDVYFVDNVGDIIRETASNGFDKVQSGSVSVVLSANVEVAQLMGNANLSATGNELNNFVYGNSGNNTLFGGGGNDLLDGGLGNDTFIGGAGNDSLRDLAGGSDTFIFSGQFGGDAIEGFQAGSGLVDVIQLDRSQFADINAVVAAWADVSGNTVITYGSNSITIIGVSTAQLVSNDFSFV